MFFDEEDKEEEREGACEEDLAGDRDVEYVRTGDWRADKALLEVLAAVEVSEEGEDE